MKRPVLSPRLELHLLRNQNADLLDTLRAINRILSPGTRTMDEMMYAMGEALDRARGAIARATET